MRQPIKQLTLRLHDETNELVVRSVEEGELKAYVENVGHEPNNLSPEHPGYKLWTWRTKRDGDLSVLLGFNP